MGNNVIKSILPSQCPHCHKSIMVAIQTVSPVLSEILTEEDVKIAKDEVRIAAEKTLKGDDLDQTLVWLDDEDTVFGKNDVASIIESFKK